AAAAGRVAGAVGGVRGADGGDGCPPLRRDRTGQRADGTHQADRRERGADQRERCAVDRAVPGNAMNIDLTGKRALVTGASRGIGEAIARRLAESGAHVILAARSAARVNEFAETLKGEGRSAEGFELDITAADVRDRVKTLIETQPVDILVNNAGVTDDDLFIRMKPEAWSNVLRTNLDSAFHITQELVKKMIRARWGRVINISSVVGLMGNPGQVNY